MSKLTDIKYRIDHLDGGAFQNLCDAYLCCRGYGTGYSLGMNTGTDKTAKGNPDTYFLTTNDKYVLVMYTIQYGYTRQTTSSYQRSLPLRKYLLTPLVLQHHKSPQHMKR